MTAAMPIPIETTERAIIGRASKQMNVMKDRSALSTRSFRVKATLEFSMESSIEDEQ